MRAALKGKPIEGGFSFLAACGPGEYVVGHVFPLRLPDGTERPCRVRKVTYDTSPVIVDGVTYPGTAEVDVLFLDVAVAGTCTGFCKGDRAATESPASYGRDHAGIKGLFCRCCNQWLVQMSGEDFASAIAAGRLAPGVTADHARLFTCRTCFYDVVSARELRPS